MSFEAGGHHNNGGHRSERIAEEMRHELTLMLGGELKDPRLALPLAVTEVRLTPDMRTVRVFVHLEGTGEERLEAMKGLRAAAKFVRHELVERLNLRRAPEVIFVADESQEYGQHISELLQKVIEPKNEPKNEPKKNP
jgi:ribosome-binding factor A